MLRTILAATLACTSLAAGAQAYPARAVRFIVPYAPGGTYDLYARAIGPKLGEIWGQPVLVENRVGANGIIGTDLVAKSPADGYTIMMGGVGPHGINVSLYSKLPYDPVRDFAPVIHISSAPNVLVVHPSVDAHSVKELIALAKSRPGQLTYSSAGSGSSQHLSAEMFKTMAGVEMTHVPYKGGSPGAVAVLAGEVSLMFASTSDVVRLIRAGRVRALAVTSVRRIPALPDTPTMIEAGVDGYDATAWFGVLAPAATPKDIIDKLNQDISRVMQLPEVAEVIAQQGSAEAIGGSPEQFGAFIRADITKWAKAVKDAGAKAD
jgi:tripartite-type tricarboxylate transporter receptor subunit TctC